jgi:hypothetical protein
MLLDNSNKLFRRDDKPIIPQRPKLFQRPETDASTSNEDPNSWSTRIAAVASDDGQRSKFEKLLGMHKKDQSKPALKVVTDEEKKAMQKEISKVNFKFTIITHSSRWKTTSIRSMNNPALSHILSEAVVYEFPSYQ